MKKLIASILSAAMLVSLAGCGDKGGGSNDSQTSDTSEPTAQLSNPVKKTEDGDIDMEAALAYETDFDALVAELEEREVDVTQPVSLNARNNPNTMKVWELLRSNYGTKIFSGQQQRDIGNLYEDRVYYNATEDLPAIKGFDFIFSTGSYVNRDFIDGALEWGTKSGGLVTFTWHWNVPRDVDNPDKGHAFYMDNEGVKIINFNARNATTPGTKEYEVAVHDMDLIASYLQELEAAGITVLWRPFHEASGSWFWWGIQPGDKNARETYQRLWYMMYDRFENYHKLSNLIWIWNGQVGRLNVNPNTYDIGGIDFYASKLDHSPVSAEYKKLDKCVYDGKMLALTETGYVPDPQQCVDEGVMWLYYMVWDGGFIYEPTNKSNLGSTPVTDLYGTPNPNPDRITNELLKQYFTNDAMITWNDLTDLSEEHKLPQPLVTWSYFKDPANQ
ncbi:MAG: beta-mannanase [Oscillospiraceae bacterium]|nr:beta-mannanase [Oscillospiraceae bacterium]